MANRPNKRLVSSSALAFAVAVTLLSCEDSVVFESVERRATVADLPPCSAENAGAEIFVEDERMLYTCGEEGWTPFAKPADTATAPAKTLLRGCGADFVPDDTASTCGADGTFTDSRDGRVYKCVKVGNQIWMAENLDFGEKMSGSQSHASAVYAQKYCFENDTANCAKYGGLYQWATAMGLCVEYGAQSAQEVVQTPHHRGICPAGWHVPTQEEWQTLVEFVQSPTENDVGRALKSQTGWDEEPFCASWSSTEGPYWNYYLACTASDTGANGNDIYGWNALPSGFLDNGVIYFRVPKTIDTYPINQAVFKKTSAEFWTATEVESSPDMAVRYSIGAATDSVWSGASNKKENSARSLRCVQD